MLDAYVPEMNYGFLTVTALSFENETQQIVLLIVLSFDIMNSMFMYLLQYFIEFCRKFKSK